MPWPSLPTTYTHSHLILALFSGAAISLLFKHHLDNRDYHFRSRLPSIFLTDEAADLLSSLTNPPKDPEHHVPTTGEGLQAAIGNTPLILLPHLSALTKSSIYAKLEHLNPNGSPKDRVALSILNALSTPDPANPGPVLKEGDTIYEGTVGSTGISLAALCRSRRLQAHIIMPSDQSVEKGQLLGKLGAKVTKVPPAPIVDQGHFVNVAKRLAGEQTEEFENGVQVTELESIIVDGINVEREVKKPKWRGRGWFADQFEREANWRAHYEGTGPEIYAQMQHFQRQKMDGKPRIDAFVAGAGTGGTISGVGLYLKDELGDEVKIVLADPQGSGLYNKVKHGVFWSQYEREGTRRREQVDTVIEGIGLVRSTKNWEVGFEKGVIDDAVKVTDQMARNMARWLVEREGLWVGGSSAVNCMLILLRQCYGRAMLTYLVQASQQ
jgi:cysteine synthase